MKRLFCLFLVLMLSCLRSWAQDIPVGTWRTHLNYTNGRNIALAGDLVYVGTENGLFYYDTSDESVQIFSSLDGLSDNGIADLAYSSDFETLVIGYENGNIDLVQEGEIINVRSLLNSSRANKNIRSIQLLGKLAIFSTGFGGVELNLETFAIQDFYENIGGSTSEGFATATYADSLFLATDQGVFSVSLAESVNRQDFNNWTRISALSGVRSLAPFGGKLYLSAPNDRLYSYAQGELLPMEVGVGVPHQSLTAGASRLYLVAGNQILLISADGAATPLDAPLSQAPREVAADGSTLWVADFQAGLVNETTAQFFFPSGPLSAKSFRLTQIQNRILAVAGGFDGNLQPELEPASFYVFEEGRWTNYTSQPSVVGATQLPTASDLIGAAYSASQQKLYLGAFSGEVLAGSLAEGSFEKLTDAPGRITDLAIGSDDELLLSTAAGEIYQLQESGFEELARANSPVELLPDLAGNLWVRQLRSGVLVTDGQGQQRTLSHTEASGNLRGDRATSLAVDRNGSVWVGTNDGITEFFDVFSIFSGANGTFVRDVEGNVILKDAIVTSIAVDGGNRKWLGTQNNGVFLYDPSGRNLLHFTAENSPLLSDQLLDIAIQPKSGEVFFATSQGLVSYRGTATEPVEKQGSVRVFPNPVRPDFGGQITISGLVANAQVRITDVSGKLVYQTRSQGGTAVWNGNRFDGGRVQTGIYLIFSADEEGNETIVAKVAIVQ